MPAQARVETGVIRSKTRVARSTDGAAIGGVIVAIGGLSTQQIKRMPAVVIENRRHLEAGQSAPPGAVEDSRDDHFVSLIEVGSSAFRTHVQVVLRSVVAVEIRGGVDGVAVGVIRHDRGGLVELLLDLDNAALIKGGPRRSVLIVLGNERAVETTAVGAGWYGLVKGVNRGTSIPVPVGDRLSVGQGYRHKTRILEVRINRHGEMDRVRIDVAEGNRETGAKLPLNA